jgi:hypothetical protein
MIPANIGPLRNKLSFLAATSQGMNKLLARIEVALDMVDDLTPTQKSELIDLVQIHATNVTTAYNDVVTVYTATEEVP